MKKNLLSVGMLAVLVGGGLVGCDSNKGGKEMTLVVSGPAAHQAFVLEQCEAFKKSDKKWKNLKFEFMDKGEGDIAGLTDWTTGPDVYAYASDQILALVSKSAIAEIPSAYRAGIDAMGEKALAASKLGTKYYGYPYAGDNGYFLYYKKSAFKDDEVTSIEKVLDVCQKAGKKFQYKLQDAFYGMGLMFSFGSRFNVTIDNRGAITETTADFNGANGMLAIKAMAKIMQSSAWDDENNVAPTGDVALAAVDGSWNAAQFKKDMGADYACVKLPTVTVGDKTANIGSYLGYKLYGVNPQKASGDTARLEASHALANYLVSEGVQKARFDALTVAPTNPTVAALDDVKNEPHIKAINDQAAFSVPQTAVPAASWDAAKNMALALKEKIKAGTTMTDAEYQTLLDTMNTAVIGAAAE